MKIGNIGEIWKKAGEKKLIVAAAVFGIVLMLLPASSGAGKKTETSQEAMPEFSVSEQEEKLKAILENIDGAGKVKVMLTLKESTEQVFANDEDAKDGEVKSETVIVSTGSGTEKAVTVKYIYPVYLGAAVVAEGADRASVKMAITEAVSAVTGLEPWQISVIKMRGN